VSIRPHCTRSTTGTDVGLFVSPPGTEGVRKVMDPELCDNVPPASRKMLVCTGRKCLEIQKYACEQESAQPRRDSTCDFVFGLGVWK
jgi:hypothetical protein